jgi:hypothetical protein
MHDKLSLPPESCLVLSSLCSYDHALRFDDVLHLLRGGVGCNQG